jgi:hypothetical protein
MITLQMLLCTLQKKKAGRLLNGRTYDNMPKRPRVASLPQRERNALIREVESWYPKAVPTPTLQIA